MSWKHQENFNFVKKQDDKVSWQDLSIYIRINQLKFNYNTIEDVYMAYDKPQRDLA